MIDYEHNNPSISKIKRADDPVLELAGLIDLAEASTASINNHIDLIAKNRIRMIFIGSISYGIIAAAGVSSSSRRFLEIINETNYGYLLYLFGIFALIVLAALLYGGFIAQMHIKRSKKELRIEYDIHSRLMSLIDDQVRRMDMLNEIGPIVRATLEIRIRRLTLSVKQA